MRLKHWMNDSDWGMPKNVKTLSPCHSVRTKPTSTGLGSNPRLHDRRMATGAICYNSDFLQTHRFAEWRASAIC